MTAMVLPLEGEELTYGLERLRIGCGDAHFAATRKLAVRVLDHGAASRHDRSSRHFHLMDKAGRAEVAVLERGGDFLEVSADGGNVLRVCAVALQLDAAAIGQVFEAMLGCVLIDAHGCGTTLLQCRERAVRCVRTGRVVFGSVICAGHQYESGQRAGAESHEVSTCQSCVSVLP